MPKTLVAGAGSALVDLLIEENDDYITSMGAEKGGMTLVELEKINEALEKASGSPQVVPGGSACNTLVGISSLGGEALMIGRSGKDEMAELFNRGLEQSGVQAQIGTSDTSTGRVLSVVTPDAQRTMFTYLGAAAELNPQDVQQSFFNEAAIVHLEGYQLFNQPLTEAVLKGAKEAGAMLSLDLASFEVVGATKAFLESIIPEYVDILIANEDEAKAYTGKNEEDSLEIFSKLAKIAVVKKGKHGALASRDGEKVAVEAKLVKAIDTTGAGDLWASGFLYGLTHDYSLEQAAKLGACVASEVVQVMGAVIPEDGWLRIKAFNEQLIA
ncbi:MAG: adenosine kinase [Fibrobacteria bacterium]|nr:adenosine kinase [Fibrobacteria bacterium]